MIDGQRLTVDDLIANVGITSEEPIDEAKARAEFGKYAKILTADTELSLSSNLDEATYEAHRSFGPFCAKPPTFRRSTVRPWLPTLLTTTFKLYSAGLIAAMNMRD